MSFSPTQCGFDRLEFQFIPYIKICLNDTAVMLRQLLYKLCHLCLQRTTVLTQFLQANIFIICDVRDCIKRFYSVIHPDPSHIDYTYIFQYSKVPFFKR